MSFAIQMECLLAPCCLPPQVTVTERSALPEGETLLQLRRMLAAQQDYELLGAELIAGPAAAEALAAAAGGDGAGSQERRAGQQGAHGGDWAGAVKTGACGWAGGRM